MTIAKIISGGRHGSDSGALDAAIEMRIPHGGKCPKDKVSEDGDEIDKYNLTEIDQKGFSPRVEENVKDADATIVFSYGDSLGQLALQYAKNNKKPCLHVNLHFDSADKIISFLNKKFDQEKEIVLNVSGKSESSIEGVHNNVKNIMKEVIAQTNSIEND